MEIDKIEKTFVEERDCGARLSLPEYNTIRMKTENNGMGNYVVIQTKRWAFDETSLEEFVQQIKKMLQESNTQPHDSVI